jgi:ferredoxin
MKVAIRYFTGTGNTARAATLMQKTFQSAGWTVDRREIRSRMADPYSGIEDAELLVVAFPALGFSPPVVVRTWLKRLPKAGKARKPVAGERRAAVLCVGGAIVVKGRYVPGWGAGAPFNAERSLIHRGWTVTGVGEVSYPENWLQVSNPPNEAEAADIRARNDPEVRAFAAALAQGESPRLDRSTTGRLAMAGIAPLFRLGGRRMLARLFIADSSCTGCGLCARTCPAVAIRLRRGRPRWNLRCAACNRCINICPMKSIRTSSLNLAFHLAFAICTTAAALSFPLPDEFTLPLRGLIRAAAILLLFIFQIGPYSWLLAILGRVKKLRGAFSASFMAGYRRYLAPDFKPTGTE